MSDLILDFLVSHKERIGPACGMVLLGLFFANVILPYIHYKIYFKDFYND